jgi:hypothetical protein
LRGSLTELLGLGEDATSVYAEVSVEVAQGSAQKVKVQVPETVTINQVSGALVSDWEFRKGELAVTFLEPVEASTRFVISGETRLPREGAIAIPLMRLLDAERSNGGVAVEVLGAGEIKDLKEQGLEKVEPADLGQVIAARQSPSLVAFRSRPGPGDAPRSLAFDLIRYTQQAVLTANIEEARYQVLMSKEGKTLVQARYAVRNNTKNFLRVALPTGAAVWSASVAGKPVRPGQAPDGALLFPLTKASGSEDSAAFPLEILYLSRGSAWEDKGRASLTLPALDLSVSKTGVTLYYPPLFRLTPETGAFRTDSFTAPMSAALGGEGNPADAETPPSAGGVGSAGMGAGCCGGTDKGQAATQSLVDSYRAKSDLAKTRRTAPLRISFPAVGPSIFLVSELTPENQSPHVDLTFQKEKERKGGVK